MIAVLPFKGVRSFINPIQSFDQLRFRRAFVGFHIDDVQKVSPISRCLEIEAAHPAMVVAEQKLLSQLRKQLSTMLRQLLNTFGQLELALHVPPPFGDGHHIVDHHHRRHIPFIQHLLDPQQLFL